MDFHSHAAHDSMITRAIEIDPGSSSFDSDALDQSPAASAARTSSRVNHAASANFAVAERELLIRVTQGMKANH